jgi:hypothetical protein
MAETAVCFGIWSDFVFLSQQKGKIEQRYFAQKIKPIQNYILSNKSI